MGKLIVIDKEKVERSEHSELIKTAISLLIKHGVATELSTDESIETVIEKILQPNVSAMFSAGLRVNNFQNITND